MARIQARVDDDLKNRVQKYASKHGLLRRQAYADLIEAGLESKSEEQS